MSESEAFDSYFRISSMTSSRIVYEECRGLWTVDVARAYVAEIRRKAAALISDGWALYSDLSEYKTSHPDAVAIVGESYGWLMEHNLRFNTCVVESATARMQVKRMIAESEIGHVCHAFASFEEADAFLRSHGFDPSERPSHMR